jgi:hypothetical protein
VSSPTPPEGYTRIRMVAGPDTQEDDLHWAGQIVVVPPGYPLGSGSGSPSRLLNVYGWTQTGADGHQEWLMGSPLGSATVEFIRNIPARGWLDTTQRAVYRQQGRRLILLGVPDAEVREILNLLYDAAAANEAALNAAAGG